MKHTPLNLKNLKLTPLEIAQINLMDAHRYYYNCFIKYGPNMFEPDGSLFLAKDDGTRTNYPGRQMILDTMKYYEEKDDSHFYKRCARLKRVLDDYDKRFPQK